MWSRDLKKIYCVETKLRDVCDFLFWWQSVGWSNQGQLKIVWGVGSLHFSTFIRCTQSGHDISYIRLTLSHLTVPLPADLS